MRIALAVTLSLTPVMLLAQEPGRKARAQAPTPAAAESKLRGVWEPVNYPADVYLNDVYFATPDVGWMTAGAHGKAGMIIGTRDGGASWSAQVGDPESSDPAFHDLRFIDAHTGWVLQDASAGEYKLLHTSDGQEWAQAGSLERHWGVPDYEFVSARLGFRIDGNDNVSRIMRTSDGGRTWEEAFSCEATIQAQGLTRKVDCALKTLHFPSRRVGYALGGAHGAPRTLFVAKTEDGGKSWTLSVVPNVGGDTEVYFNQAAFFTDEATGVVSLSDGRIYRTTDGARSWKGMVGIPGPVIRFADPAVGWSFSSGQTLSYTTDGGGRWTTRKFTFPAKVAAFSLPRRDRGFVVGEHGMVYRYRIAAPAEAATPGFIAAPAMPVFDSPLDEQVTELASVVDALEAAVAAAPEASAAAKAEVEKAEVEKESGAAVEVESEEETEYTETEEGHSEEIVADGPVESSGFASSCCGKPLSRLELVLAAVGSTVPQFLAGHKNVNLLVAGLQMLTDLPGRIRDLNGALRALRKAPDKASATVALERVSTAIAALGRSTAFAFQKEVPPATGQAAESEQGAEVTEAAAAPSSPNEELEVEEERPVAAEPAEESAPGAGDPSAVEEAASEIGAVAEEAANEAKQETKEQARQDAKKAIKKKLRF